MHFLFEKLVEESTVSVNELKLFAAIDNLQLIFYVLINPSQMVKGFYEYNLLR